MLEKGLVQIYTGSGKGKTTAAFGLALRAAGHGNNVLIYQFLKPAALDLGERKAAGSIEGVQIRILREPWDMRNSFDDKEAVGRVRTEIGRVCRELAKYAADKSYDVIILDEIVFCLDKGLAQVADVKRLIDGRDVGVEIVLTGRGASKELIELADLVTEMRVVKHPYDNGINGREGIEF